MIKWAVFVSGEGSNLQHFLDLEKSSLKESKIVVVIADRECRAIERAKTAGKKTIVISSAAEFSEKALSFLEENKIDSIFLLGFMRILKPAFLSQWKKPIVNLHPSWLPHHKGANAIQKAFEAGDASMGISLHEVVEEVDGGRILRQISFPRDPKASLSEITERVHEFERKIVGDYLFDLERNKSFSKDRG
jgi:phosphoribosylglycinamide formyltransferase-1